MPILTPDCDELRAHETPALVLDRAALARNIAAMAEAARRAGVDLRPHAKTHKSPDIAALQMRAGASPAQRRRRRRRWRRRGSAASSSRRQ